MELLLFFKFKNKGCCARATPSIAAEAGPKRIANKILIVIKIIRGIFKESTLNYNNKISLSVKAGGVSYLPLLLKFLKTPP